MFPVEVGHKRASTFLLDHTRHTPRDFLQLLKHLQYFAGSAMQLSEDQVFSGMGSYSRDYFLPEIIDELDGYFERHDIEEFFRLLRLQRKRRFFFDDLLTLCQAKSYLNAKGLQNLLRAMFDCSALGNYAETSTAFGPSMRYTSKYRNRGTDLNIEEGLFLHRALWSALNLLPDDKLDK